MLSFHKLSKLQEEYLNSPTINRGTALQIIGRLRQGRNIIFGAHLFSVGREKWIKGADQVFEDLEHTSDSTVRFIRGDYGVGKTNFAARLFHNALSRGWVATYIELTDQVMFHEFHQVFAQIVNKMYLPDPKIISTVDPFPPAGFLGTLDLHYRKILSALGLSPGADIPGSALRDVLARINTVLHKGRICGDFAAAVRAYFQGRIEGDTDTVDVISRWFSADGDIILPERGIYKPISKINGKDHLRSLSIFINGIGYKGMLIVIDELERIMGQSRLARRKAYTILRELIDNVDGENGMKVTCFYMAAPPGQFESQKGFIEVEALASRIQEPIVFKDRIVDYTGTMIDLDNSPLSEDEQIQLALRLCSIHSAAREWDSTQIITQSEVTRLVKEINSKRPYSGIRVREFCLEFVGILEEAYANHRI